MNAVLELHQAVLFNPTANPSAMQSMRGTFDVNAFGSGLHTEDTIVLTPSTGHESASHDRLSFSQGHGGGVLSLADPDVFDAVFGGHDFLDLPEIHQGGEDEDSPLRSATPNMPLDEKMGLWMGGQSEKESAI
ncbi:hypothetical protein NLJ89_g7497 [Agrocybe chaxingu]|uniref:Uncharacterized protein n=1 Tax=Agrocybe chaxingu TaxID=84603 RepID=A0A9W8JW99_9AGAR|nr:hypothetical protein NLJ89_g7497 [Agrocybe chaxingu]